MGTTKGILVVIMFNKRQKGTATVHIISENWCESLDFPKLGVSSQDHNSNTITHPENE